VLLVSRVGPNLLHLIITFISPFLIYLSRFCHPRSILHSIRVLPSYTFLQAAFGRKVYDGTNKLSCPNDLIKHLHLPSHGMNEEKQTINEKLQCLGQLLISYQTVDSSSKPSLISPEAL